jgi:hypothetical protein
VRSIHIQKIDLYPIALPLVETLKTSFGEEPFKTAILVAPAPISCSGVDRQNH